MLVLMPMPVLALVLALQLVFAHQRWPGVLEYAATVLITFAVALLTFVLSSRGPGDMKCRAWCSGG